jgi:hypothetical protein
MKNIYNLILMWLSDIKSGINLYMCMWGGGGDYTHTHTHIYIYIYTNVAHERTIRSNFNINV